MTTPAEPYELDLQFPAMTPGQRLFFDVNGYVVIENTLSSEEVENIRNALYDLKQNFESSDNPADHRVNGCILYDHRPPNYTCFAHLPEAHPALLYYLTHPRMIGLVEEAMGGKVRLEESASIINRRDPDAGQETPFRFNFHRGGQPGFDSYVYDDLYHCTFVKTLTNLTDLGPDDGGTTVIAGSHKLNCPEDEMVTAAYEEPSLIHQVEAPAGSTMLMCETLIHATGQIRSDNERVMIIGGYSHPKQQALWEPSPGFAEAQPEHMRSLVAGRPFWTWPERHRRLGTPAGSQNDAPYKARMWSVGHQDH